MTEIHLTHPQHAEQSEGDTIPFYPDHFRTEVKVTIGIILLTLVVGVIGLAFPVGLEEPADPMNTPLHVKPEWYFLALYQLLKFIPKTAGAVLPLLLIGLIAIWPFLDRKPEASPKATRIRFWVTVGLVVIAIALTIWGEVS